jgi:uncharacterized coiled-coil DUF342 family protein
MGFVSLKEDIDELREENAHRLRGLDNLIHSLRDARNLERLRAVEAGLRETADQLIRHFEKVREQAKASFEEAVKFLHDPNVRITAKLEKITKERDRIRQERDQLKVELENNRASSTKIRKENSSLTKEIDALVTERKKLRLELRRLKH